MTVLNIIRRGAFVACGALVLTSAQAAPKHTGELIVQFKKDATEAQISDTLKKGHLKEKKHVQSKAMKVKGQAGLILVEPELAFDQALESLKNDPAVELAEPNYTYTHQAISNDSYVTGNYTWGLYGDTTSPANVYGSQAAEAWAAGYTGTNGVYVAVIDEGIQVSHSDLAANIWKNPFEILDGIDNDGNGYVDDVNGWNFYDDNRQVYTSGGDTHGTHVAGTIGAKGGNGTGVAGVNWNVTILSGKFLGPEGGDTFAAVEAIDYFVDLKKRHNLNLVAINASWGGGGYSQALHASINRAAKAGILFVAAAGNDALNNDTSASYPANIDSRSGTSTESAASYDAVISVAAIDKNGALASFSNYGATKVDIGAPGVGILSTYPDGYSYMNGTSMATPHVTGAVALYASTHPGATAASIRSALIGSAIATPSLSGKTVTGGRLNLSTIIAPTVTLPPPTVTVPLAPSGVSVTVAQPTVSYTAAATLKWNASAGATSYKILRATTSGDSGTVIATTSSASFTMTVSGSPSYYYRVVSVNSAGDSAPSVAVRAVVPSPTPTQLTATAISPTSLRLQWKDNSSNESGFRLEYWTGSSWVKFGTAAAGIASVDVNGLASRTTYSFRVRAYYGSSSTGYSNTATGTTL